MPTDSIWFGLIRLPKLTSVIVAMLEQTNPFDDRDVGNFGVTAHFVCTLTSVYETVRVTYFTIHHRIDHLM